MRIPLLRICMLALLLPVFTAVQAQEQTVTGTVISAEDNQPLPGVSVLVKGTTNGTVTDIDGAFRLTVPTEGVTLIFSYVGFKEQRVELGSQTTLSISLEPDATELSEIVVTAFGLEQEKKQLGYSVQELQSEAIMETRQTNIVNALQGQVSGVQVTSAGGAPGMSSRIIIRGLTSIDPTSNNQPLFIVDGVPIDNSTQEDNGTPRGMTNRAADLNPNDIESVNVLKGAAATALYGIRAANGAVIITTKKGEAGKTQVRVNSSVGFEEVNKFPEFQGEYGQGFSGLHQPTSFWPSWGAPVRAVQVFEPEHRFYDNNRALMETGVVLDNSISVSGGNEKATFFTSFGNLQHDGVLPNSSWDRTSAKITGTVKVNEKFNFSGSINYINSGGNRVPFDRMLETMMYQSVTQDVTDYINPDGSQVFTGSSDNPIYVAKFRTFEDDVNRIIGNINLNYDVTDWFRVSYRLGSDYYAEERTEITPGPLGIDTEVRPLSSLGFMEETRINSRDINSTLNLTFQHDITDRLNATLRVGQDVFTRTREQIRASGTTFQIPRFFNLSNLTENITNTQSFRDRRLMGVYGDLMLNWDNVLFLNFTARNDWTSTLPEENRSFFYPAVNLGFAFSDVFDLPEFFTFGKLRASYAEVGKDTNPYRTSATYSAAQIGDSYLGFTRNSSLGTPELRPERTTAIEFGGDFRFFDNRLSLDIAWYQQNSIDMILPVPVSNATGYTRIFTNAGELRNRGLELVLNARAVETQDFSWDVTLNFTRNRNEVIEIREGIENIVLGSQFGYAGSSVTMTIVEGAPYGNLYGRSFERYYANGTPDNLTELDRDLPLLIGENGFPIINRNQLVLGNTQPDWIGGIRNTLNYKGLRLSFLIDGRYGIDQYSQFDNFYSAFGKLDYSLNRNDVVVFSGFQSDGTPNDVPVWLGQGIGPDGNNYGAGFYRNYYRGSSENFVQDASFIKLRNITLGYTLPPTLIDKLPFTNVDVSVAANNIILWTPWTGYDPESFSAGAGGNATGFTGLGYPGIRSAFFTLNLTF